MSYLMHERPCRPQRRWVRMAAFLDASGHQPTYLALSLRVAATHSKLTLCGS
jgi:hypothetical protein